MICHATNSLEWFFLYLHLCTYTGMKVLLSEHTQVRSCSVLMHVPQFVVCAVVAFILSVFLRVTCAHSECHGSGDNDGLWILLLLVLLATILSGTGLHTCRYGSSSVRSSTACEHARDSNTCCRPFLKQAHVAAQVAQAAQITTETIQHVVDTRLVGQSENFSGKERWPSCAITNWAYRVRAVDTYLINDSIRWSQRKSEQRSDPTCAEAALHPVVLHPGFAAQGTSANQTHQRRTRTWVRCVAIDGARSRAERSIETRRHALVEFPEVLSGPKES